eukprot:967316-Amphidinium_carterae.1
MDEEMRRSCCCYVVQKGWCCKSHVETRLSRCLLLGKDVAVRHYMEPWDHWVTETADKWSEDS